MILRGGREVDHCTTSAHSSHMVWITSGLQRWLDVWLPPVPFCASCPHYFHHTGFGSYSSSSSWITNLGLRSTEGSCIPVLAIKIIWTTAREEQGHCSFFLHNFRSVFCPASKSRQCHSAVVNSPYLLILWGFHEDHCWEQWYPEVLSTYLCSFWITVHLQSCCWSS